MIWNLLYLAAFLGCAVVFTAFGWARPDITLSDDDTGDRAGIAIIATLIALVWPFALLIAVVAHLARRLTEKLALDREDTDA